MRGLAARIMGQRPRVPEPPGSGWLYDLGAGLTVAGILLPEAVAYAAIAGVAPRYALIAGLIGLCTYPWLGTSRYAVVAPTSSAAAVCASVTATGGPEMAFALVLLTGVLFLGAAALRAGFLGAFVSRPVLRGFAWALTLSIVLRQLPHLAGVEAGKGSLAQLLRGLAASLPHWHAASLSLGGATLALWLLLKHWIRRWVTLPASLIVLLLGMALSAFMDTATLGVAQVGRFEWAWPSPHWPRLDQAGWQRILELAPALLLILFAESWGSVRTLALQEGDAVSADRELAALGVANLLSGLVRGLPVGAGFSASMASQGAGAQSKLAGFFAALAMGLFIWGGSSWLAALPMPVLAALVIGILSPHLLPTAVITTLHQGRDAWLAIVAAAGVLLSGVVFGMLLAITLSLLMALQRFARPAVTELGQLDDSRDYIDRERHAAAKAEPHALIVRPEEPLFFANTEQVLLDIAQRARERDARVVVLSLELTDALDTTATEALWEFCDRLGTEGRSVLLARAKDRPRGAIRRYWQRRQQDMPPCFWSVADAVNEARALSAQART